MTPQDEDDTCELPEYDNSQSQRSRTPSPTDHTSQTKGGVASQEDHTHGEDESDEDDEFGNIHIVELHKGEEPLGVYLTHYTSPEGRYVETTRWLGKAWGNFEKKVSRIQKPLPLKIKVNLRSVKRLRQSLIEINIA